MNIIRRHEPAASPPVVSGWEPFRMMRDIMRWDPFREMAPIFSEEKLAFIPDVDVKETPNAFIFKADVPGMKEKDIEISLAGNRLTLSGKREEERREEKETYFAMERTYGEFNRTFTLPVGTDLEHVLAELKDGVLTVTVPKIPEAQPKKIPVGGETPVAKA